MIRAAVYLLPIAVNLVIGAMLYIAPTRLAEAGLSPTAAGGAISAWALVSALGSFGIGRFLSERNARMLLEISLGLFSAAFLAFVLAPGLYLQYIWLFVTGVATACFCAPFQVFMKSLEHGRSDGLVRATSLYSAAWSFGMATGPGLAALLWTFFPLRGWVAAFLFNAVLMALGALAIRPLERAARGDCGSAAAGPAVADSAREVPEAARPDLAWYGWMLTGAAFTSVAVVKALLPSWGVWQELPKTRAGLLIAAVYYAHSLTSLLLLRSRDWMYRPGLVATASVSGAAGLLLLAFAPGGLPVQLVAALLLGGYSGVVGFCLVYYALAHPLKAPRYVAVNEVTVGLCGILGPLAGGKVMNAVYSQTHWPGAAFALCVLLVIPAAAAHALRTRALTFGPDARGLAPAGCQHPTAGTQKRSDEGKNTTAGKDFERR